MLMIFQTNQTKYFSDRFISRSRVYLSHLENTSNRSHSKISDRSSNLKLPPRSMRDVLSPIIHQREYLNDDTFNSQLECQTLFLPYCGQNPIFFRISCICVSPSSPSIEMRPDVDLSIPTRMNVVVVFPAPLCPNREKTCPS